MSRIRVAICAALIVGALTLAGFSAGANAKASQAAQPASRIDASMRQLFRSGSLNSMVFGVWVNGRPLVSAALGNALPGVRATKNMHFRIGNVTEAFTVTLLLRLVDQGKVSLSDSVSKWFPQLPRADQVTLRMLATSTSGYADYVTSNSFSNAFEAFPFRQFAPMSLIRLGTGLPAVFTPGKSWAFSDTNFMLLGAILQKITGKPLAAALHQQILHRLGLRQTAMPSNANIPSPVMHAYTPERGRYEESTFWNPSWASLNGSMTSSLVDMGKWARAMGTGSVLSPASHALQVGPENVGLGPLKPEFYYGMGVAVSKGWTVTNPQLVGYNGTVSYFPAKKIAVVAFSTLGRRSQLPVQYSTNALLRIARILTPSSVPVLQSRPRG
jgi:CubicO group peptidase (beta-lactamase class C family)